MIKIRCNTFETNSSSSHSLVIRKDNTFYEDESVYYTKEEIQDELSWLLSDDKKTYGKSWCDWYYGRAPFRILTTFRDKLSYAYANYYYDKDKVKELLDIIRKYIPEIKKFGKVKDVGVDEPWLAGWLEKYNLSLEEFLTNRKYTVICDGDEYNIWMDMVDTGIIDLNAAENIKTSKQLDKELGLGEM